MPAAQVTLFLCGDVMTCRGVDPIARPDNAVVTTWATPVAQAAFAHSLCRRCAV